MWRNNKNKRKVILIIVLICSSQLWVSTIHSMAIAIHLALSYAAQMRIVASLLQYIPIAQSNSLSQQFLIDHFLKTHVIDQKNMPVPHLQGAYLPPIRCDAHDLQAKYQEQVVFMMQLSKKAQETVTQKTVGVNKSHAVAATIIGQPCVAKADLESAKINQAITQKVIELQHAQPGIYQQQALITKYAQENSWKVVSMPGSLKYVSPSGRVAVEFKAIMPNSQAAFFEMQQQYAHSLREMKRFIVTHADYKMAIETQIKMAIHAMAQLNSKHAHERILAIEQLSQLHIAGPPDIYLRKTIDELLKGFIQSDGLIPECALIEQNNYCQGFIKRFAQTIQDDLGDVLPIKKWTESLDLKTIHNARDYPISRAHNVGHGAREFVHLGYNYRALLNANDVHQARLACIQHAQRYNFAEVEKIINGHTSDSILSTIHVHFLKEFQAKVAHEQAIIAAYKNALFDQYGFYRSCSNNPWLLTLSEHDKLQYAHSPEKLALINNHLLAQAAIKDELMKRWQIAESAPDKIHQMVYVMMGEQAQNLHNPVAMIDVAVELTKNEPEATNFFFLPNGVFKDFAQSKRAASLPAWPELLKNENAETRRALNYLVYLEDNVSNSRIADRAQNGLDKYQAADLTEPVKTIDRIFQRSLNEMLYDKMREHNVYKVEDLQRKIAQAQVEEKSVLPDFDVAKSVELFRRALKQSELQAACGVPARLSHPEELSICKTKEEKIPEFSCGASIAHSGDYAEPQETCKTVGNEWKDPLEAKGACTTGQAPGRDMQCNHSKGALPSFQGEAISPENLPIIIVPDGALKDLDPKEAEAVGRVAREIESVLEEKSKEWLQAPTEQKTAEKKQLGQKQKKVEQCQEHQVVTYGGKHLHVPEELKDIITKPEEWNLAQIFDGAIVTPTELGEQIPAVVDYEHLLCPIIKVNCKEKTMIFTGFHHDYLGKIKESGLIEYTEVVEHADGFWQAKWKYKHGNGKHKFSGFFPDHWTPTQVMEAIKEAIKNQSAEPVFERGSWSFIGTTRKNIEIKIIFEADRSNNALTGKIITAYPLFNTGE